MTADKDGTLVTINPLEYASLIINYVAAMYVLVHVDSPPDNPHPVVLLYADNTAAESWMQKARKSSAGGRTLGIQAVLMINNPVGTNVDHVISMDNVVADRISRLPTESHLAHEMTILCQDFPC